MNARAKIATVKDEAATDAPELKHETVFQAIAAAVGEVRTLGKSDRNKFDGYDFASIDKFIALVNPICARHGLFPWANLREIENYEHGAKKSIYGRYKFDISLMHETGGVLGPLNFIVAVPQNGAQAAGSAQSYALKQFFRGVFMIPTGDKDDADLIPKDQDVGGEGKGGKPRPEPEFDPKAELARMEVALRGQINQAALDKLWGQKSFVTMAGRLPTDMRSRLTTIHAELRAAFSKESQAKADASAAISDDEIPY